MSYAKKVNIKLNKLLLATSALSILTYSPVADAMFGSQVFAKAKAKLKKAEQTEVDNSKKNQNADVPIKEYKVPDYVLEKANEKKSDDLGGSWTKSEIEGNPYTDLLSTNNLNVGKPYEVNNSKEIHFIQTSFIETDENKLPKIIIEKASEKALEVDNNILKAEHSQTERLNNNKSTFANPLMAGLLNGLKGRREVIQDSEMEVSETDMEKSDVFDYDHNTRLQKEKERELKAQERKDEFLKSLQRKADEEREAQELEEKARQDGFKAALEALNKPKGQDAAFEGGNDLSNDLSQDRIFLNPIDFAVTDTSSISAIETTQENISESIDKGLQELSPRPRQENREVKINGDLPEPDLNRKFLLIDSKDLENAYSLNIDLSDYSSRTSGNKSERSSDSEVSGFLSRNSSNVSLKSFETDSPRDENLNNKAGDNFKTDEVDSNTNVGLSGSLKDEPEIKVEISETSSPVNLPPMPNPLTESEIANINYEMPSSFPHVVLNELNTDAPVLPEQVSPRNISPELAETNNISDLHKSNIQTDEAPLPVNNEKIDAVKSPELIPNPVITIKKTKDDNSTPANKLEENTTEGLLLGFIENPLEFKDKDNVDPTGDYGSSAPTNENTLSENEPKGMHGIPNFGVIKNLSRDLISNSINNRIEYIDNGFISAAAGDNMYNPNQSVWLSGLYGHSKQKPLNNAVGFKGKAQGFSVGFDRKINESNLIGITYSNIYSEFKTLNKDFTKVKANNHAVSVYGNHDLNDSLILTEIFSLGKSYLKTGSKVLAQGGEISSSAKLRSVSLDAQATVSYKVKINESILLLPNVGLRYSHSKDGAYSEKNSLSKNTEVRSKSMNVLTGIVGLKASMPIYFDSGLTLSPTLSAAYERTIFIKEQNSKVKFAWIKDEFINMPQIKNNKDSLSLSAGLNFDKNNIKITTSYGTKISRKFLSHQGAVKIKILF